MNATIATALLSGPQGSYPPHQPGHQWRFANCDRMPVSYTSGQPSKPRRYPTCWWASSQWNHTVSSTLWQRAWTSSPHSPHPSTSAYARHLKSRHPFVFAAQYLISLSDNNINICAAQWADHQLECGVDEQPYKTPHSHPWH